MKRIGFLVIAIVFTLSLTTVSYAANEVTGDWKGNTFYMDSADLFSQLVTAKFCNNYYEVRVSGNIEYSAGTSCSPTEEMVLDTSDTFWLYISTDLWDYSVLEHGVRYIGRGEVLIKEWNWDFIPE